MAMLDIPFVKSPSENACALASYAMVAKYFFPETSLEKISKISHWEPRYVVWAFKFWLWLMDKGIKVTEYDRIDYKAWAEKGIEGLRKSTSKKELEFYQNNTKDINSYSVDVQRVLQHRNFLHKKKSPTFTDLENACNEGFPCEVVLNSQIMDNGQRFTLHRVIPLKITGNFVIFHDPDFGPARKVTRDLFEKSWLEIAEPELCIYQRSGIF